MAQCWLKPFGTSRPRNLLPDRWTERLPPEGFPMMTGPSRPESPPPMSPDDRVVLHAVGHVRIFGVARVTAEPVYDPESRWAPRWPWILPCRLECWVPRIADGPHTSELVPQRVMGRIQRGSLQVPLGDAEFARVLRALLACPSVIRAG